MEEKSLTVMPDQQVMTIETLKGQVNLIQQVMKEIMVKDEHYGVIPGTQKPTLLKPGAEKLCFTFFLDPDYEILKEVLQADFVYYRIKCVLMNEETRRKRSGLGSCNSKETKYRWRNIEEPTDKLVPKAYWEKRDKQILGGKDYKPWKNPEDDKWYITKVQKIENDNPLDLDNTLLKMACKRALVSATLNATAASDIFTQDVEDMGNGQLKKDSSQQAPPKRGHSPKEDKPPGKKLNGPKPISDAQRKKMWAMTKEKGMNDEDAKSFMDFLKHEKAEKIIVDDKETITDKSASNILDNFDEYFAEFGEKYMEAS